MKNTFILAVLFMFSVALNAHSSELPSIKFTPQFRVWDCPVGYTDPEECKYKEESLEPQRLSVSREVFGFWIGEMEFSRNDVAPSYFKVSFVFAQGNEKSPDDYLLGITAGFNSNHDKNPLMEVNFESGKAPPWIHHHTGTQRFEDRESAISIVLTDISVSQRHMPESK